MQGEDCAAIGEDCAAQGEDCAALGIGRTWEQFGEVAFVEPATEDECRAVWEDMRQEEREQADHNGETIDAALDVIGKCRRTGAIYHKGELLGIGLILDGGEDSILNFVRANAAMKRGVHKLTWAKAIGDVVRHVKRQEVAAGHAGRLLFVTPTDYARAVEFYCRHAHGRVVGQAEIMGRPHVVMEVVGEEE